MEALLAGRDPNAWMLFFPIALFLYYLFVWFAVGRDPRPGTVISQYGPPEGMSPAAVRYLITTGSDGRSFAAVLAQLTYRGFINVQPLGEKYRIFKETRAPADVSLLAPEEAQVLRILFSDGREVVLDPSEGPLLGVYVAAIQKELVKRMEGKYFTRNAGWIAFAVFATILCVFAFALSAKGKDTSGLVLLSWWFFFVTSILGLIVRVSFLPAWRNAFRARKGFGMVLFGAAVLGVFLTVCGWIAYHITTNVSLSCALTLISAVALHLLFAPSLRRVTPLGRRALDHVEGFRSFLLKVEQDQLDRLHRPDDELQTADQFLSYAIALEIKEAWGDHLAQAFFATTTMR